MERRVERDNVRSRGGGRQRRGEGRQVPPRVFQRKAWAGGRVRGRGAVWGANHVGAGPGLHAVLFGGAQPQLLFFLWHCLHVSARHLLVSPCGFAEGAAAMPVSPRTLPSDVPTNKYHMQTYLRGPLSTLCGACCGCQIIFAIAQPAQTAWYTLRPQRLLPSSRYAAACPDSHAVTRHLPPPPTVSVHLRQVRFQQRRLGFSKQVLGRQCCRLQRWLPKHGGQ